MPDRLRYHRPDKPKFRGTGGTLVSVRCGSAENWWINVFRGRARVFEGERGLLAALDKTPQQFQNHDMIIVRYEGPSGAPNRQGAAHHLRQ